MHKILAHAALAALLAAPVAAQTTDNDYRWNGDRDSDWDPAHHYSRTDREQRELAAEDRVYRGSDGRYYCKRSDGTTGLIIGAAGGGLLGNIIDGGHNRVAGTLIGGALGALAGRAIDQNSDIRCR